VGEYISIKHSVGMGGVNYRPDVIRVQQLLIYLILHRKILGASGVPLTGICEDGTIEAIRLFQIQSGSSAIPDGRVDPRGDTIRMMNKAAGHKKPEWAYDGSTGYGMGISFSVGPWSGGAGVAKMTLFISNGNDSNDKFKVVCWGGQLTKGFGVGPPVNVSRDYSGPDHVSGGSKIKRLPNGRDPLSPHDFEGLVLMDAGSVGAGSADYTFSSKFSVATIRTYKRDHWGAVTSLLAVRSAGQTTVAGGEMAAAAANGGLNKIARTFGWIYGGAASFTLGAGIETVYGLFKSSVEMD
jgi:hypothetical protein